MTRENAEFVTVTVARAGTPLRVALSSEWLFVIAAYAVGVGAVLALLLWSWLAMRRAERRRDDVLGRRNGAPR